MKGYLKNPEATDEAFAGGWFHTGDLAVMHPDGYVEIKDRAKDIIISGGENISSLEVEEALYRHPQVLEAAVVARPDPNWGESPCAFVTLKPGAAVDAAEHHRVVPRPSRALTRCRGPWSSVRCRRPRPARSRNSRCASEPGARDAWFDGHAGPPAFSRENRRWDRDETGTPAGVLAL